MTARARRLARPADPPPRGLIDALTAERHVIGALLSDPASTLPVVAEIGIRPEAFPRFGAVLAAAQRLAGRSEPVDVMTLAAELRAAGELSGLGGIGELMTLAEAVTDPRPEALRFYASRLRESWLLGRVKALASDLDSDPETVLPAIVNVALEYEGVRRKAPVRRLVAVDCADLLSMNVEPRRFLMNPWLRSGDLGMIFAPRGVGKTALAMGVAAAVAGGGSLMHWRSEAAYRVVYVDGELPLEVLRQRVSTSILATGCDPSGNLSILASDLQAGGFRSISEPEGQRDIEAHLDGASLLILDNVSTLCRGGEENAAEAWQAMQDWLLTLRRRGLAVLLLHHAGRNGLQRGTSKREDVLDVILKLSSPEGYDPQHGARFKVSFEKARSLFGAAVGRFEAALDTDPDGRPVWTYRLLGEELQEQVADLHEAGLSVTGIAKELGRNKGTVSKILRRLKEGGAR